jgi:hypothetical protein
MLAAGRLSAAPAVITFAIACCALALAVVLTVAVAAGQ